MSRTANYLHQLADYANPRTRTEPCGFLGLSNCVRDYVPRFAEVVTPTTKVDASGVGIVDILYQLGDSEYERNIAIHRDDTT